MLLREASDADIPLITTMYQQDGFPYAWGDPARTRYYVDIARIAGGRVLVGVENNSVIAHCECLLCHEPEPMGFYAFAEALEVHHAFRRRGIGEAMVRHTIELAERAGCRFYETWPEDERSRRLYEKTGLRPHETFYRVRAPASATAEILARRPTVTQPQEMGLRNNPSREFICVAGRQYPTSYLWTRAFEAKLRGFPDWQITKALSVQVEGAALPSVVMVDKHFAYVFVSPDDVDNWLLISSMLGYGARLAEASGQDYVETFLASQTFHRLVPKLWSVAEATEENIMMRVYLPGSSHGAR